VRESALLDRWLEEVLATPGLTGLASIEEAREVLLQDALRARPFLDELGGEIVDIGSGGGSPGIPLAVALPERYFTLLEAERRKADALVHLARDVPNVNVVWGRAEEQTVASYDVALAKALAKPPVAAELTLPLVRPGGAAILWVGVSADRDGVARVAQAVGGELEREHDGLLVLRKLGHTPPGFPRRPGMAKKRPLA
jgi:16S rRNA (guanine527-N7)-methyltransferase